MNIGEIPAKHAYHRGGTSAVVDVPNDRRITYGALDGLVRRTANGLRDDLGLDEPFLSQEVERFGGLLGQADDPLGIACRHRRLTIN